jgi:hypothetical protein
MPFSLALTQTMHSKSNINNGIAMFSLKNPAGFEPGPSVPEADAISIAPPRPGILLTFISLKTKYEIFQ